MTTTQDLLGVITALRQRLDQAQHLADDAGTAVATVLEQTSQETLETLKKRIANGFQDQHGLDQTLRQGYRIDPGHSLTELPPHLTSRAARLVEQTRDLLTQLKQFAVESLLQDEDRPATLHYQDSVLLADLVLRCLQTLPDQPSLQLRFCAGVDVLLTMIRQRVAILETVIHRHQRAEGQLQDLCSLFDRLQQGTLETLEPLFALAEDIIAESSAGQPLFILSRCWEQPPNFVAAHCLTTAGVLARVAGADANWRGDLLESVAAALVHDVGMLTIPAELLAQPDSLDDEQRAAIERHCRSGANLFARFEKACPFLAEAALNHHERLDGTGYPSGLIDRQIKPLVRLLAVCDVYAALCSPRPHRPALDTRQALRETMLLAQKGFLDGDCARLLSRLSYYPAGTAVELNDGSCGVVVGAEQTTGDDGRPARPVVVLLSGPAGELLPDQQWLDLAAIAGRHVRRSLSESECSKLFGQNYPQYLYP